MKLSHLKRQKPELNIRVFRAVHAGTCYRCEQPYNGTERFDSGDLVVQWSNGVPRHYRCGLQELGVTQRENGTWL